MATTEHKAEHKSVFDDRFAYLKMPREILTCKILSEPVRACNPSIAADKLPMFSCPEGPDFSEFFNKLELHEQIILSRIVFWTRKGMPCTHTNAQFAELIGMSVNTAGRVIAKLIRHKLVDAHYHNDKSQQRRGSYRDLTALIGVKSERIVKRFAAQVVKRNLAQAGNYLPTRGDATSPNATLKGPLPPHPRGGTTNLTTNNNYQPTSLPPVRRATSAEKKRIRKSLEDDGLLKKDIPPMTEQQFEAKKNLQLKALNDSEDLVGAANE